MSELKPGDRVVWEYVVPGRVSLREIREWESTEPFSFEKRETGGVVLALSGDAVTVAKDGGGHEVFHRNYLRHP